MAEDLNSSTTPPPPDSDSGDDDGPTTSLKFIEYRCKETSLGERKTAPITIIDQPSTNERTYHIHTRQNHRGIHFINKSNMKSMSSSLPLEVFMPKSHFESITKVLQKTSVGSVISDGINYYSVISDKRDAKNISGSLVENTLRKLVQYLTLKNIQIDLYYIMRGNRKEFRPDQFVLIFTNSPVHLVCHRLIKLKRSKTGYTYQLPPDLEKKSRGQPERGMVAFTNVYENPTWSIVIKDTSNPTTRKSHKKRETVSKVDECLSPIDPLIPGLTVLTPKNYRAAVTTVSPLHPHNVSHTASQISPDARRSLFSKPAQGPSTTLTQHDSVIGTDSLRDSSTSRKRKDSTEEEKIIGKSMFIIAVPIPSWITAAHNSVELFFWVAIPNERGEGLGWRNAQEYFDAVTQLGVVGARRIARGKGLIRVINDHPALNGAWLVWMGGCFRLKSYSVTPPRETQMSQKPRERSERSIIVEDLRLSESSSSSSSSSSDSDSSSNSSSESDNEEEQQKKSESDAVEEEQEKSESNAEKEQQEKSESDEEEEQQEKSEQKELSQTPLSSRCPALHPTLIGSLINSQATTTPHFVDKPAEPEDEKEFITPKDTGEIRFRIQKYVQENDGDWSSPAAKMRTNTQVTLVARQGSKTLRLNPLPIYDKQKQKSRKKV